MQRRGVRSEFPPLRTLDATPGNLRSATTSFIGRETEVKELAELVRAHRLVTLTGVGGVGKTRLALQVARRIATSSPMGCGSSSSPPSATRRRCPTRWRRCLGVTPSRA